MKNKTKLSATALATIMASQIAGATNLRSEATDNKSVLEIAYAYEKECRSLSDLIIDLENDSDRTFSLEDFNMSGEQDDMSIKFDENNKAVIDAVGRRT